VLTRLGWPDIAPGGVVVGPATDAQQQAGVVSLMGAGLPVVERYLPLQWLRVQVRCLAPTLEEADKISFLVNKELHARTRVVARQRSTDHRFLVHLMNITAGPSMHYDSPETWETLLFGEVLIGTQPIED
jgi:hypothetical protein